MSAVPAVREPSARYFGSRPALIDHFGLALPAEGGVARLRELILSLALRGKLSEQSARDETAADYLRRHLLASATVEPVSNAEPFDVPSNWVWVPLGQLGVVGSSSRVHQSDWTTSGVPFYRAREVVVLSKHGHVQNELFISEALFQRLASKGLVPEEGDIMLTGVGTIGVPYAVQAHDRFYFKDASVLIFKNKLRIDARYLTLCFRSQYWKRRIHETSMGTTVDTLTISRASTVPLPIPPIAEQARIVARVDELMRLCDALEEKGRLAAEQHARLLSTLLGTLTDSAAPEELAANWQRVAEHFDLLLDRPEAVDAFEASILELAVRGHLVDQSDSDVPAHEVLGRLRQSRKVRRKIVELSDDIDMADVNLRVPAGWAWASVDELSADEENAIADGPFGANLKTEHYINKPGFRVIRLQNIGAGVFKGEHEAFIDRERFDRLSRHHVRAGDIVVAGLVDESIRCCLVPEHLGPALVKADCYRYAVHPELSAEYVCLYLSSATAHEFASIHHHGLTLTRIGLGNFRSIPVLLPPPSEQARIVARVTELRQLCATLRERLEAQQATQSRLAEALVEQALSA